MKQLIIVKLLFLAVITSNAQTYEITYERKANIEYQLRNETRVDVRKRVAKHLASDLAKFELKSCIGVSNYSRLTKEFTDTYYSTNVGSSDSIYKDMQQMLLLKQTSLNGELFLIKDSLPNYNWIETGKLKDVLGYRCKQIKGTVNNVELIAWYTSEILINDGPDIFWFKNGLILEINTKIHTITVVKVKTEKKNSSINKPSRGKEMNLEAYNQKLNEYKASLIIDKY